MGLGLEPVPEVLLHPSVIERFTAHAPGLTAVTRRTLRTNLRFLALPAGLAVLELGGRYPPRVGETEAGVAGGALGERGGKYAGQLVSALRCPP